MRFLTIAVTFALLPYSSFINAYPNSFLRGRQDGTPQNQDTADGISGSSSSSTTLTSTSTSSAFNISSTSSDDDIQSDATASPGPSGDHVGDPMVWVGDAGASPGTPSPISSPPVSTAAPSTSANDTWTNSSSADTSSSDLTSSESTSPETTSSSVSWTITSTSFATSTKISGQPNTTVFTNSSTFPVMTSSTITSTPSSSSTPVVTTASSAQFKQEMPSNISGPPNSYSQTHTTLQGTETDLPIWFNQSGAAIIVVPILPVPGLSIPPPGIDFPSLSIGEDGEAHEDENSHDDKQTSSKGQEQQSSTSRIRSTSSISSSSQSTTTSSTSSVMSNTTSSASQTRTSSSTPPSSSSPAAPTPWVLFPKDGLTNKNDQITARLIQTYGEARIQTLKNPVDGGIIFWQGPLTDADLPSYRQDPQISSLVREPSWTLSLDVDAADSPSNNISSMAKRDNGDYNSRIVKVDALATPELAVISHPPGVGSLPSASYVYDKTAGAGSTIYIIDDGIKPSGTNWDQNGGHKRQILIPPNVELGDVPWDQVSDEIKLGSTGGHGSECFAFAAGGVNGVARQADVVAVKWPVKQDQFINHNFPEYSFTNEVESVTFSSVMQAFTLVYEDIKAQKLEGKAVINLSWGIGGGGEPEDVPSQDAKSAWIKLLNAIVSDTGAILVTSSGNDAANPMAPSTFVDRFPALLAPDVPSMIVVGGVSNDGTTWRKSQGGPLVTLAAPADNLVLDNPGFPNIVTAGTSFAGAFVSGLAAYLLTAPQYQFQFAGKPISQTGANMEALLLLLAYPRVDGGLPVIFNGEYWVDQSYDASSSEARIQNPPRCSRRRLGRRDDGVCTLGIIPTNNTQPSGSVVSSSSTLLISSTSSSPSPLFASSSSTSLAINTSSLTTSSQSSSTSSPPPAIPANTSSTTLSPIPVSSTSSCRPGPSTPPPSTLGGIARRDNTANAGECSSAAGSMTDIISQIDATTSSQCDCLRASQRCRILTEQWTVGYNYTAATTYTYTSGPRQRLPQCEQLPNGATLGCSATYSCPRADLYGLLGDQISDSFGPYLSEANTNRSCTTTTLRNGCTITTQACVNCQDNLPRYAPAARVKSGGPAR